MRAQFLLIGFFVAFSAPLAFGQTRIISDAQVELVSQSSVAPEQRGGGNGQRGMRVTDTFRTRERQGRQVSLNRRLTAAVYRECARHQIDPRLVFSLIKQESGGKLHAVSSKGARGPMQLMPGTAARFGARNLYDPDEAVAAGVAYLVTLLDQFGGNVSQALAAYNAGSAPVQAFLLGKRMVLANGRVINPRGVRTVSGIPPYRETQAYVENIANYYRGLRESSNKAAISQ
jgi:soluble lytic murein transglycosylase-like protein